MKNKKNFLLLSTLCLLPMASMCAADSYGIVDFNSCMMESKYGKKELESLESIKDQMTKLIGDIETQLKEIAEKFNDPDYMDSLSPDAEQDLKVQFQSLSEEMNRYQSQYYQVMNQANMQIVQSIAGYVNQASTQVARTSKIPLVIHKDAIFYYDPEYDITSAVIEEMNKSFELEHKNTSQVEKKGEE